MRVRNDGLKYQLSPFIWCTQRTTYIYSTHKVPCIWGLKLCYAVLPDRNGTTWGAMLIFRTKYVLATEHTHCVGGVSVHDVCVYSMWSCRCMCVCVCVHDFTGNTLLTAHHGSKEFYHPMLTHSSPEHAIYCVLHTL